MPAFAGMTKRKCALNRFGDSRLSTAPLSHVIGVCMVRASRDNGVAGTCRPLDPAR
jgi:hypothetical protein